MLHNNWRRLLTLNDDLKKLSPQDVFKAFNKYITNITWVYQGDPAKADAKLFTQSTAPKPQKLPEVILDRKVN
ncbi:MAG: hypothetical protein M3R72_06875 [Bacteroidota bacterium]|nr:hypothetical protein [Bacteroidota bacterium]